MAAGLSSGQQVAFLLDRMKLPCWDLEWFDQLPTPFRSVVVDLRTSTVVVLDDGSLSRALRATMSIPAVFGPVEIGPYPLVDGGVLTTCRPTSCDTSGRPWRSRSGSGRTRRRKGRRRR